MIHSFYVIIYYIKCYFVYNDTKINIHKCINNINTLSMMYKYFYILDDIDIFLSLLLYHLPSIFVRLARIMDATLHPVTWFTVYHLIYYGAWSSVFSLIGAFVLPYIPKYLIARTRPCHTKIQMVDNNIKTHQNRTSGFYGADIYSMPSGHASVSVCIVANILWNTGSNFASCYHLLCFPVIVWCMSVSVSRVILGAHWIGDVIVGWFFGLAWFFAWRFIFNRL